MSAPGSYTFLPWLRSGIANQITAADFAAGGTERATVPVTVRVTGRPVGGGTDVAQDVPRDVALYGPGDIVGIDTRAIVRAEPRNWITNFEPDYLALVEFYDEDFPWRYTPTAPHGPRERLRPWLSLVVLEEGEFEDAGTVPGKPLPVIAVTDFARLPAADELWAWAHVHVDQRIADAAGGVVSEDMTAILPQLSSLIAADPDLALSRLVCPRHLEENRAYHAFVVPTFETGRLAGLGLDPADAPSATASAWESYTDRAEADRLPVYHRWFFRTGTAGDFEQLVRLLEPRPLDPRVGTRDMDVLRPGSDLPPIADPPLAGVLRLGGALRVPEGSLNAAELAEAQRYENWDTPYPHAFQTAAADLVNLADDLVADGPDDPDPLIAPPLYGRWHALTSRLLTDRDGTPASPDDNWVHELNLDPRFRVAAGFGTRVVQDRQEQYMGAAWEQVGDVLEANRRIRLAQVAREAGGRLYARHLEGNLAAAGTVLAITAPVHPRILAGGVTVRHAAATSLLGATAASAAMRRVVRPRSRLVRAVGLGAAAPLAGLLPRLAAGEVAAAPPKVAPPGIGTVADIAEEILPERERRWRRRLAQLARLWVPVALVVLLLLAVVLIVVGAWPFALLVLAVLVAIVLVFLRLGGWTLLTRGRDPRLVTADVIAETITPEAVAALPRAPGFTLAEPRPDPPALETGATDSAEAARYKEALDDVARTLVGSSQVSERPVRRPLDVPALAGDIVGALRPDLTVPRRVLLGIEVPERLAELVVERFVEAMAYPVIDVPMYRPLADLSSELFVPNVNLIEQNSITLLETNQRFIEAYMVGLNHELARELLWREFPTDQRGTPFRQFWDVTAYLGPADEGQDERRERLRDIPPLHLWPRTSALGDHDHREASGDEEEVVLAIRGELLKKYPTCVVYAHRAEWVRNDDGSIDLDAERRLVTLTTAQEADPPRSIIRTPLYEAKVDPDITFFGFDLTVPAARGGTGENDDDDPGWFFVLRERPGEPRFGLDIERTGALNVWNDLAWPDVAAASALFIPVGAQVTSPPLVEPTDASVAEKLPQWEEDRFVAWNADMTAADVAYVLYQAPVLVAVHAREMLP